MVALIDKRNSQESQRKAPVREVRRLVDWIARDFYNIISASLGK